MQGRDLRLALADNRLDHILIIAVLRQLDMALGIGNIDGKLLVKQQALHRIYEFRFIQGHTYIGKRRITGFCKRTLKADLSMFAAMITADGIIPMCETAAALIAVASPRIGIFFDIFQRRHDFKGGTGRIYSLGSPVQQTGILFIRSHTVPDICDFIRIKIRLGYHGQNFSRIHLHDHDRSLINAHGIIGRLLKIHIQRGIQIISRIFPARS